MDIAKLQMEVDSRPVKEATEALSGFTKQSELATSAYGDMHEATTRSHRVLEEKRKAEQEATQSTQVAAEAQWTLAGAVAQTDEAVQEARLGMEMLRLEFEQGDISRDEYAQGLQDLKGRLQDLDVDTIGSVRTTRMLNKEMAGLGGEAQSTGRMVSGSTTALNSMGTIMGTLATGSGNLSTRLARVGQNLGIMTQYSGGAASAISSLAGFILSPAGLIFALGAAIPLVVKLTQSLRDKSQAFFDVDQAGQAYVRTLDDVLNRVSELSQAGRSMFDTTSLQEQLEWSKALEESHRERLEALEQERTSIIDSTKGLGLTAQQGLRLSKISKERAVIEGFIEKELERQLALQSEIQAIEILRDSEVADRLSQERQSREAAEWMEEHQKRMVDERLDQRERAEERIAEQIKRQGEEAELAERRRQEFQRLLESAPDLDEVDDGAEIQRALTRQKLAEDARMAAIQDSIIAERLLRLKMEKEFQQERLELIQQGITDEESLINLRLAQAKRLADALKAHNDQIFDPRSIGGIRQEIARLEAEKEKLWDPKRIEEYDRRIKALQGNLEDLTGETQKLDSAARGLGFTFQSAFEDAILGGEKLQDILNAILEDIARISMRAAITEPLGTALGGFISDINPFSTRSVNDALIMKDGQIIEPHADDHILAFKDPAVLGGRSDVNVSVNVVNHSGAQVEVQERQTPGGVRMDIMIKEAVESLMDSGRLDRVMGRNFAVTRQGVRHG